MTCDIESGNGSIRQWKCCGGILPKEEIVFFAQIIPIYIVILCSIVSLVLDRGEVHIWTVLLGSCLGYLLPNPNLTTKKKKKRHDISVLRDVTE